MTLRAPLIESNPTCSLTLGTSLVGSPLLARSTALAARSVLVLDHPTLLRGAKSVTHLGVDADDLRDGDSETAQGRDALDLLLQRRIIVILLMQKLTLAEKVMHKLFGGLHNIPGRRRWLTRPDPANNHA
jgi:hypothetical protein